VSTNLLSGGESRVGAAKPNSHTPHEALVPSLGRSPDRLSGAQIRSRWKSQDRGGGPSLCTPHPRIRGSLSRARCRPESSPYLYGSGCRAAARAQKPVGKTNMRGDFAANRVYAPHRRAIGTSGPPPPTIPARRTISASCSRAQTGRRRSSELLFLPATRSRPRDRRAVHKLSRVQNPRDCRKIE